MKHFKSLEAITLPSAIQKIWRITFVLLIVFIAFLFLPWQQTIMGSGEVRAFLPSKRAYTITAPIDGVISRFFVKDFDMVHQGDSLFEMRDLDPKLEERLSRILNSLARQKRDLAVQIDQLQKQRASTKELYKQKIDSITLQKEALHAKIEALEAAKKAAKSDLKAKKNAYERALKLFGYGIVSKQQVEEHKAKYEGAKAKLAQMEASLIATAQQIRLLDQTIEQLRQERQIKLLGLDKEIASIRKKIEGILQKMESGKIQKERYDFRLVTAKSDGYVLRILQNDTNKVIKRYDPILRFAPKTNRRAIWVQLPKLHMPLVKKGLRARIVFYGWPTLYIPGWPIIQHGTYGGVVEKVEYSSQGEFFNVLVIEDLEEEPWPSPSLLRPGTQASVWINLAVVPMWYELWRVMAAQPPVMVNDE